MLPSVKPRRILPRQNDSNFMNSTSGMSNGMSNTNGVSGINAVKPFLSVQSGSTNLVPEFNSSIVLSPFKHSSQQPLYQAPSPSPSLQYSDSSSSVSSLLSPVASARSAAFYSPDSATFCSPLPNAATFCSPNAVTFRSPVPDAFYSPLPNAATFCSSADVATFCSSPEAFTPCSSPNAATIDSDDESKSETDFEDIGYSAFNLLRKDSFDDSPADDHLLFLRSLSREELPSTPRNNLSQCEHKDICQDGSATYCNDCGKKVAESIGGDKEWNSFSGSVDNSRCHAFSTKSKSIADDIKGIKIPPEVVSLADNYYKKVTATNPKDGLKKVYRADNRKGIIIACIIMAFHDCGISITLRRIMEMFKPVKRKCVYAGIKIMYYHKIGKNYKNVCIDIVKDVLEDLGNEDPQCNEDIRNIYLKVQGAKSARIDSCKASSVAYGLVCYYLFSKQKQISVRDFAARVKSTETTIVKVCKEISRILKTPHIFPYD